MPILNGESVRTRMAQLGLTQEVVAAKIGRTPRTLWSALNGRNVSSETHRLLADALGAEPRDLMSGDTQRVRVREIAGEWTGVAHDVVVPNELEYSIAPVTYQIACRFSQSGMHVDGDCVVEARFRSRVRLVGRAWEEGQVFQLEYENLQSEFLDYGAIMLQFDAFGEKLSGYFLGREIGHGTPFVFARVELFRKSVGKAARKTTFVPDNPR